MLQGVSENSVSVFVAFECHDFSTPEFWTCQRMRGSARCCLGAVWAPWGAVPLPLEELGVGSRETRSGSGKPFLIESKDFPPKPLSSKLKKIYIIFLI